MLLGMNPSRKSLTHRLNCSFIGSDGADMGLKISPDGTYSGLAGRAQRNETEVAWVMYRLDFFASEHKLPGIPLPIGMAADVVIFMKKRPSSTSPLGLVDMCAGNFDLITVEFLFISFFFFGVTLAFTTRPTSRVGVMMRNIIDNLYRSVFAIIDQENFEAANDPSRVAVLFFNIFLLFGIHGIAFGLIGSDLVTDVDHPIVESLDEFSNTSFVQPKVMGNWLIMNVLEKTGSSSELWPLKQAIEANREKNVVYINEGGLSGEVIGYDKALIVPEIMRRYGNAAACTYAPDVRKQLAASKNSFAQGIFVALMNSMIDPVLREMLEFFTLTVVEAGDPEGISRQALISELAPDVSMEEDMIRMRHECFEGFKHEHRSPGSFQLELYEPLFRAVGIMFAIAILILMAERMIGKFFPNMGRNRSLRRSRKVRHRSAQHVRLIRRQEANIVRPSSAPTTTTRTADSYQHSCIK